MTKISPTWKSLRGISLIEMLVYTALLALVATLVSGAVILLLRTQIHLSVARDIANSAALAMERIEREIRWADSASTTLSTFNTSPGMLTLIGSASGTPRTVQILVATGTINIITNGVSEGSLLLPNVTATNLLFRHMDNGRTEAVHFSLTIEGTRRGVVYSESFQSGAVLRGSY